MFRSTFNASPVMAHPWALITQSFNPLDICSICSSMNINHNLHRSVTHNIRISRIVAHHSKTQKRYLVTFHLSPLCAYMPKYMLHQHTNNWTVSVSQGSQKLPRINDSNTSALSGGLHSDHSYHIILHKKPTLAKFTQESPASCYSSQSNKISVKSIHKSPVPNSSASDLTNALHTKKKYLINWNSQRIIFQHSLH